MNGPFDGLPPLPRGVDGRDWAARLAACRTRYEEALDEGRSVALDDYAAESPVEFFAVASECFFQDPHRLIRFDAELYDLLAVSWQQDPKSRVPMSSLRGR
jgi:Mlc titration factor MtfA (ptsG expression regulator)